MELSRFANSSVFTIQATGCTTKETQLDSRQEQEIFLLSGASTPALGLTVPPSSSMKTGVAFKGRRATGHGAALSPLSSGVKNEGSNVSIPPYAFVFTQIRWCFRIIILFRTLDDGQVNNTKSHQYCITHS